eukprot:scaffold236856_cov14-Tisochrysis_lutea.AAC.1
MFIQTKTYSDSAISFQINSKVVTLERHQRSPDNESEYLAGNSHIISVRHEILKFSTEHKQCPRDIEAPSLAPES